MERSIAGILEAEGVFNLFPLIHLAEIETLLIDHNFGRNGPRGTGNHPERQQGTAQNSPCHGSIPLSLELLSPYRRPEFNIPVTGLANQFADGSRQ
jgi:hypothetical protein